MDKSRHTSLLLWVDLETTGLDPLRHEIAEVAWQLTYPDLTPLSSCPMQDYVLQLEHEHWMRAEEAARRMHDSSGLSISTLKSTARLHAVESMILADMTISALPIQLAGASVHFDRGFIERQMRRVFSRLHPRQLDVTSLWIACWALGVGPDATKPIANKAHRAQDDLKYSQYKYRQYLDDLERAFAHADYSDRK